MGKHPVYKEHIESGVVWLGKVPDHWVPLRFKRALVEKRKTANSNLEAGSISFGRVVYKSSDSVSAETKASYQEVLPGEFLVNPLNMNFDLKSLRTALSSIPVVVSTGYIVLRISRNLEKRYIRWLLHEFDVAHMKTLGSGVRQTINYTDIGNSFFYEPPPEEQKQIASFLDYETAKIDALIEKQQQLIALLGEKRQAVISHAVTKGLNRDAPMRDSGVEWLGEVPEHWIASRLKYHAWQIVDGAHFTPTYTDKGVPFLRVTDIQTFPIDHSTIKFIPEAEHEELVERCHPKRGDLLLSKNGTIGVPRVVDWDWDFSIFVSLCLIKLKRSLNVQFIYYFFLTHEIKEQIFGLIKQSTVINLHLDKIENFWIAIPPLEEQQLIVELLDANIGKYDLQINHAQAINELLQERRTALISAAVTGKIDVRGWKPPSTDVETEKDVA